MIVVCSLQPLVPLSGGKAVEFYYIGKSDGISQALSLVVPGGILNYDFFYLHKDSYTTKVILGR